MAGSKKASSNITARVHRIERGYRRSEDDQLAVEEPLEIRLDGKSVAVVMRSPGNDEELAAGFLYTEGIVRGSGELQSAEHRHDPKNPDLANVVDVISAGSIDLDKRGWQRNFVSASSCGLCGKLTIESVRLQVPSVRDDALSVTPALLHTLPGKMRAGQAGFDETGGIHAAALFDPEGSLRILREDIGRHNAVDKVIGTAVLAGHVPLRGHILMVSGRASFEIVQKALMARIPIIAAISAPSSLAVELADSCSMALVGFLRDDSLNVYSGSYRITG